MQTGSSSKFTRKKRHPKRRRGSGKISQGKPGKKKNVKNKGAHNKRKNTRKEECRILPSIKPREETCLTNQANNHMHCNGCQLK